MNIDDLLRAGNDILDDVMEAVNSNQYSDLGDKIRGHVREAVQAVSEPDMSAGGGQAQGKADPRGQQAQGKAAPYGNKYGAQQSGAAGYGRNSRGQQAGASGNGWNAAGRQGQPQAAPGSGYGYRQVTAKRSNFLLRRIGRAGSTVQTVFGGLGLLAFGVPTIICLAELIMEGGGAMLAGTIIFGILTAVAGGLLHGGIRGNKLVSRYYEYGRLLGDAEYVNIPQLAAQIGKPEKEVRKDLLEMMRKGYLPQAKMDSQQKTLILTDQAYSLYLQAEAGRQQRAAEEEAQRKAAEAQQKTAARERKKKGAEPEQTPEVREILERGNAYIRKVRDVNDMIPDTEEMSTKLYRLEDIMHRIFEQVKKQPESAAGLRRFMDYYLPTTEKLLDAYVELDKQPVNGSNITKTKQEIDDAMDVINDAFENLLNSLFENMAWDISSDISVMKTMMAQDGLTKKDPLFGSGLYTGRPAEKEPVPVYTGSGEQSEEKKHMAEK